MQIVNKTLKQTCNSCKQRGLQARHPGRQNVETSKKKRHTLKGNNIFWMMFNLNIFSPAPFGQQRVLTVSDQSSAEANTGFSEWTVMLLQHFEH